MYKISKNKTSIHSKHTILLIGTNDVASSKSVDEIMSLFQKLITLIRTKSSINIIISGIIPRPCDVYKDPNETRMKDVNKELQILCRDRHVSFLHTYRIFLSNNKPIRSLFEFYDHGLHLNSEGIRKLRRFFHITVSHLQWRLIRHVCAACFSVFHFRLAPVDSVQTTLRASGVLVSMFPEC